MTGEDDGVQFTGPPEPIVTETEDGDEVVKVAYVAEDTTRNPPETTVKTVRVGTFQCQRCGVEQDHIPPTDGQLQEPHECTGCERQGPFTHVGVGEATARMALRADGMWSPPTELPDTPYDGLWVHVKQYISDHWDAGDDDNADAMYAGLTAFALSTWFRENLTFVPHLMLMGKTTGGKTRLLKTLAEVSYRAHVTASATPASMFRLIDTYDVSYFVSEYHGLPYDTQRELDAIVRAGQKRGEYVDRAEQTPTGYEPDSFDPFSHIAIATQFTPDDDIVNRCIQVRSSPARRDVPATLDQTKAEAIRNWLLAARYELLGSDAWDKAEADAYQYLADEEIAGRTREKLLGLVTVAKLWDAFDDFEPFVETITRQDREAAADSEDALFVEAVQNLAESKTEAEAVIGNLQIPYDGVVDEYEKLTGVEKSNTWVGHVRKRLGLEKERPRQGTVISDPDLDAKLARLAAEHNLGPQPDAENAEADEPDTELSQAEAVDLVRTRAEDLTADGPVDRQTLIEELDGKLGDRDTEHLIENALRNGEFYEPESGVIDTT